VGRRSKPLTRGCKGHPGSMTYPVSRVALNVSPSPQVSVHTPGLMTETQRPTLVTNPAADGMFRAAAETALKDGQSPADFQATLREQYPNALVRPRDLSGERRVVWYVYRDGHWVARHDAEQG
jgi:hypothetical protein